MTRAGPGLVTCIPLLTQTLRKNPRNPVVTAMVVPVALLRIALMSFMSTTRRQISDELTPIENMCSIKWTCCPMDLSITNPAEAMTVAISVATTPNTASGWEPRAVGRVTSDTPRMLRTRMPKSERVKGSERKMTASTVVMDGAVANSVRTRPTGMRAMATLPR
ncbi:unnamed protein product [Chondrus crispus]|uniref:Uncharacterized protein n=1 Tax=Chondrus crispus TaxID=2769 RepID=R7QND5_CHOCR|nr:unnamed protein product [Chondrus crispus]CDF38905.1 unnamed protein product [Chondrus crispus]|eukprot:XP_005718810.1 unnamed protein product [Chondrus crispus]